MTRTNHTGKITQFINEICKFEVLHMQTPITSFYLSYPQRTWVYQQRRNWQQSTTALSRLPTNSLHVRNRLSNVIN